MELGKPPVARFLKAQRAARRNITGQYPFMRPCHRCATVAGKTATFFNENFTAHSLERLSHHGALLRAFTLVVRTEKNHEARFDRELERLGNDRRDRGGECPG